MSLTLVVLAAGLGSRYGGLKQLDPVGPAGEIILDYSLFDAARAGFTRVVFVIREETKPAFHERFNSRIPAGMTAAYAFQSISDLPSPIGNRQSEIKNRTKPWGTGHAVWCARNTVQTPFAVINADDFYGPRAFQALADFLIGDCRMPIGSPEIANRRSEIGNHRYALVGYKLANTLSEHGQVSRGICDITPPDRPTARPPDHQLLRGIVEQKGIAATEVGPGKKFTGTETVSMNCWAFTPTLFPALENELRTFLSEITPLEGRPPCRPPSDEFYLPAAISSMVAQGTATVEVLPTNDSWFGVTYREDRPKVSTALASLVHSGTYPAKL